MASIKRNTSQQMEDTNDVVKTGYLKKLKTMKKKYFVLRGCSNSGPARLEYYDSEKKYRAGAGCKRSIELAGCFNINKKMDPKHKHAISLFTKDDCFSVVAENVDEQESWLGCLLDLQNDSYHFEYVWQVTMKPKGLGGTKNMTGQFRLCLTNREVSLVRLNSEIPEVTFQIGYIRRCGHRDCLFFMEVGRLAPTGHGELWMQVEDQATARNMHDCILGEMKNPANNAESGSFRSRSCSSSGKSIVPPQWTNNEHSSESISMFNSDQYPFNRSRTVSEGQQLSPRKNRMPPLTSEKMRPQSMCYKSSSMTSATPVLSSSPGSHYDCYPYVGHRLRSDSTESHGSRSSYSAESCASSPAVEIPVNSTYRNRSSVPPTPDSLRGNYIEDYVPMQPGDRSSTPSTPERFGSVGSNWGDAGQFESYINYQPSNSTTASEMTDSCEGCCLDLSPGSQKSERDYSDGSSYVLMEPSNKSVAASQSTGQQQQQQQQQSQQQQQIVGSPGADVTYIDMGPTGSSLPTVKESGSPEEHYLPMTPPGQSPKGNCNLRPNRGHSYLISDDTLPAEKEVPKRSYSVGCKPQPKAVLKPQTYQEKLAKMGILDNNRSSSAPHLISQKQKSNHSSNHSLPSNSPPCGSYKSEDSDFSELEYGRPRTASDSYSCRPRASSFGKSLAQGHRPRSSSHSSRCVKRSSFESVRTTSEELLRKMSQESLHFQPFMSASDSIHCKLGKKTSDYLEMVKNKGNLSKSMYTHMPMSSSPGGYSNKSGESTPYIDMGGFSSSPNQTTCDNSILMKTTSPVMSVSMGEGGWHGYPFDQYFGHRKAEYCPCPSPVPDKVMSHIKNNVSDDESQNNTEHQHNSSNNTDYYRYSSMERYPNYSLSGLTERLSLRTKSDRISSDLGVRRTKSVSHENRSQAMAALRTCEGATDAYLNMDFSKNSRDNNALILPDCPDNSALAEDTYIKLSYDNSKALKKLDSCEKSIKTECNYVIKADDASRNDNYNTEMAKLGKSDAKRPQSMFSPNFDPFFSNSPPFEIDNATSEPAAEIEPYIVFAPGKQYKTDCSSMTASPNRENTHISPYTNLDSGDLYKRSCRESLKVIHKRHSSMPVKTDLYTHTASGFMSMSASMNCARPIATSSQSKSASMSTSTSPVSSFHMDAESNEYLNLTFAPKVSTRDSCSRSSSRQNSREEENYRERPSRQNSWSKESLRHILKQSSREKEEGSSRRTSRQNSADRSEKGYRSTSRQNSAERSERGYRSTSRQNSAERSEKGYRSTSRQNSAECSEKSYRSTSRQNSAERSEKGYRSTSRQNSAERSEKCYRSTSRQNSAERSDKGYRTSRQNSGEYSDKGYRTTSRQNSRERSEKVYITSRQNSRDDKLVKGSGHESRRLSSEFNSEQMQSFSVDNAELLSKMKQSIRPEMDSPKRQCGDVHKSCEQGVGPKKNTSSSSILTEYGTAHSKSEKSGGLGAQGRHSYTEVCMMGQQASFPSNSLSSHLKPSSSSEKELNYASLELSSTETLTDSTDLHQRSPNPIKSRHSSGADEKNDSPLTYVEIDFPKTDSLQRQGSNQEVKFTL